MDFPPKQSYPYIYLGSTFIFKRKTPRDQSPHLHYFYLCPTPLGITASFTITQFLLLLYFQLCGTIVAFILWTACIQTASPQRMRMSPPPPSSIIILSTLKMARRRLRLRDPQMRRVTSWYVSTLYSHDTIGGRAYTPRNCYKTLQFMWVSVL